MMGVGSEPAVVFVDADNTLWDTDKVYANAQLELLAAVERALGITAQLNDRLAFVRSIDQAIAKQHHARLRYPPRILVKALAFALKGSSPESAARHAWKSSVADPVFCEEDVIRLEGTFLAALQSLPPLRAGVREGLKGLRESRSIVFVITEGERDRVLRTARAHCLDNLIDRIIEAPKGPRIYRRALRLIHGASSAYMIGDQLDRDIRPAKEAGLKTIYFPGGFRPNWELDEHLVRPDFRINGFDAVPGIVAGRTVSLAD
jgi:putative hydrolase of the HAD superfamily